MRTRKEIREDLNALYTQMEEQIDAPADEFKALEDQEDVLKAELKRVQKIEENRIKAASLAAGGTTGQSEKRELSMMASEVNFAKSAVETREKGRKSGLEAEVQSIADAERRESGIEARGIYKGDNVLFTVPGQFIQYGGYDPRLVNGQLSTKATIDVGTEGTDVVQTTILGVTPALKVDNAALAAGATVMPNQVGDLQIAKGSSLTMSWEGETDAEADATGSFTKFTLAPKRLGGKIPISWQMLKQASFGMNAFWRTQLQDYIASTLDAALFHGATNGPTGIDGETGVGDYSSTHNPGEAVLSWATVVGLEGTVGTANGLKGRLAYCYPSKVANQTKTKFRNTGTSADRIILDEGGMTLNGYPYFISNNIEDDYSTDNDKAYMFFGNFADLIVAFWGGVDILEDPYTSAANATTVLHSNLYVNGGVLNGGSFAFVNNILIT